MAKRNGGGDKRTVKQRLDDDARAGQIVEMALRGMTGPAIGAELGICRQRVSQILNRAVDRAAEERVGKPIKRLIRREVRIAELWCQRLDAILAGLTKPAEVLAVGEDSIEIRGAAYDGNVESAEAVIKVSAQYLKWREHVAKLRRLIEPQPINVAAGAMVLHVGPMAAKALGQAPPPPALPETTDGATH